MKLWIYRWLISLVWLFLSYAQPTRDPTTHGNDDEGCSRHSSCYDCVGLFAEDGDCVWCPKASECQSINDDACSNPSDTCIDNMFTIIFLSVVGTLVLLCCSVCYCKVRSDIDGDGLLPEQIRTLIFRNSLADQDELEWMCVICGYDNRPRTNDCPMCGTSKKFTIDYKTEKKDRYKKKLEKAAKKKDQSKQQYFLGLPLPSSGNAHEDSTMDDSRVSLSQSKRMSMSAMERLEALNYRRLNALSLRQKGARRRRMWQRVIDEDTGELVWERQNAKETTIGVAKKPLAYDPRSSVSSPAKYPGITSQVDFMSPLRESLMDHSRGNRDSFDVVLASSSPGFTSVFDEGGNDLLWERVETGNEVKSSGNNMIRPVLPDTYNVDVVDVQSVVALNMKEKQLWFLKCLSTLQRPWEDGCIRISVDREHILTQSKQQFMSLKLDELHRFMRIQFQGEQGIDAGGLEREWFASVTRELLDSKHGLFTNSAGDSGDGGSYHINPLSGKFTQNHLEYFHFSGRLFAKAIMQHHSIPATLSLPLRKQLLYLPITFSDLEFVDVELYRNLQWMRENSNVECLSLDFTVTYTDRDQTIHEELKPDGANIMVTDENKSEYLLLRLRHRMLESIKPQLQSFLTGFYEVLPADLMSVFDYQELELLMCGIPEIDMEDWKRHTEYLGEYARLGPRHKIIKWFWKAVEAMTVEERVRLLQFTTGCSRLPAQGFKALMSNDGNYRRFNIQSITKEQSLYPRAHTCFNKIDLPMYKSPAELEAYLSVVANMEVSGFYID